MERAPSNQPPHARSADFQPQKATAHVASSADVIVNDDRPFRSYQTALAFLMDRMNVERTTPGKVDPHAFKFERTEALMEALGNPHRAFRSIHVAGSKGKGSVCEMTAACLQANGYAVGLYTSPHLIDVRERIKINQRMISEDDFASCLSRVASVIPSLRKKWGEPTFFEVITGAAFLYFADQAVDIAVVEVGLGGRLDSTNVITPEACAITEIQLEHTQLLGETLAEIAREKAGIIKPGVPVFTIATQHEDVMRVLRETALARSSPLFVVGGDIEFSSRFEAGRDTGPHMKVVMTTPRITFEHVPVPLPGEHQAWNAGLVLALLDSLLQRGFDITVRDTSIGLARTPNHGRMEQINPRPKVIIDGAHNPESIAALMKAVGAHHNPENMVVVFGCAADKNVNGMLEKLALGADKIVFTKAAGTPRAMDPRELLRRYTELSGRSMQWASTLKDALNIAARAVVGRNDLICVTGSFYLAGEAKALFDEKNRSASSVTNIRLAEPKPERQKRARRRA